MKTDELIRRPGAWLGGGRDSSTVISSRVRLARNVLGTPFPGWATPGDLQVVWDGLRPIVEHLGGLADSFSFEMSNLDEVDKEVLKERHLISAELAQRGAGSGVVASTDERLSVLINEEDHLRLQAISPGLDLLATWRRLDAVDTELETHVPYAFSPRLGFLTACPTNVGTGLRASVMLHLPGLVLMGEVDPIIRAMGKIGLTVRGLGGEGTEASGNMFQISNQTTLGETEEAIVTRMRKIVLEVIGHERNARARLVEQREKVVKDYVGRAFGILSHAHVLSSKEALYLLSGLRLGTELGMVSNLSDELVNEVMLLARPGHLQKLRERSLTSPERDEVRAWIVRSKLKGVEILG